MSHKKDKMVPVRMAGHDWEKLAELADRLGTSVSEILRRAAKLYVDTA